MAISTANFKNGLTIEVDHAIWRILEFQHVKPGKGGAFVRTKLKNLRTGAVQEKTFRAGAKMEKADIQTRSMQYLYEDGDSRVFMDTDNYEQISVPDDSIKDQLLFLQENMNVDLVQYNSEVLGIDVPNTVVLEVTATEPSIKGNTASGGSKPATMSTGLVIQVPFFVNEGDKISINTQDSTYISRA